MDLEKAVLIDAVLGQEFLTWLWFRSEKNGNVFQTPKGEEFNLYLEQKLTVRGGEGDNVETASVSGPNAQFSEAKLGIRHGKRVDRALVRFELDAGDWTIQLKADDFSLNSYKTPKVDTKLEEGDDPDSPFLEKMYLLERGVSFLDAVYRTFLELRVSAAWSNELHEFNDWLTEEE